MGQTLAWVAWVCKILAWIKKMTCVAWVAWVQKIGVDRNFGIGQKMACVKIKWSESK